MLTWRKGQPKRLADDGRSEKRDASRHPRYLLEHRPLSVERPGPGETEPAAGGRTNDLGQAPAIAEATLHAQAADRM